MHSPKACVAILANGEKNLLLPFTDLALKQHIISFAFDYICLCLLQVLSFAAELFDVMGAGVCSTVPHLFLAISALLGSGLLPGTLLAISDYFLPASNSKL